MRISSFLAQPVHITLALLPTALSQLSIGKAIELCREFQQFLNFEIDVGARCINRKLVY